MVSVLVRHLVQFELEQVGEILGNRAGAATPAAATGVAVGLHLQLVFFFRLLQVLERLVLGRQRRLGLLRLQEAFGVLHFARGLRQELCDLLEGRIRRHQPAVHAIDQALHLLAQPALRQREHDQRFLDLVRRHRPAVALNLEGPGNDLTLLLRQRADFPTGAAASTTTATHRGGRLEVLAERPDAQEVDVACRLLGTAGHVVVRGLGVIRHGIAGLHAQLLEIERVPRRHFGRRLAAVVEPDCLLRPAVDRVDELQVLDREVVIGAGLDDELLYRRGIAVAARLGERDRRRLIRQHVDRVFR